MDDFSIDKEFVENIIRQISSGKCPYVDVSDVMDICEYLLEEMRLDDFEKVLTYASSLHPESNELMLQQVTMLMHQNKYDEAEALLDYLKPQEIDNPTIYIDYGELALKRGNLSKALEYFDKAMTIENEIDTDEIEDLYLLDIGTRLNYSDKSEYAIKYLKEFVRRSPDDSQGLFELAFAYEKSGMPEESVKTYEHLLDINPMHETAWYNLGILYNQQSEYDKAIMAYTTAVTIDPSYPEPFFNMGNTYVTLGKYEEAMECYFEYISYYADGNDETEFSAYQYVGECWQELGNYEMSRKFFEFVAEKMPNDASVWYDYGLTSLNLGDNPQCIKQIKMAMTLEPDVADHYFIMAQAYLNMMRKSEALKMLEKGISLDPDDVLAWFEVVKIRLLEDELFGVLDFLSEAKAKYGNIASLKVIEAFFEYTIYRNKKKTIQLLSDVANKSPYIIYEASETPVTGKMLGDRDILEALEKKGIKL